MIRTSILAFAMTALSLLTTSALAGTAGSPEDIQCPAGAAKKGEAPLLVFSASEQMNLFVCGHKDVQGKTKIHISDFEIFSKDGTGKIKSLVREKSGDFRLWNENKKLFIQEVTWFAGGWTPVFQWDVICTDSTCTRSAETCAFDKDVAIKHQAQRELRDSNWDAAQQKKMPEPSLLDSVKDSAMTGSARAQDFFLKPEKSRHFTKDGEKIFLQTQALLKRLIGNKCL